VRGSHDRRERNEDESEILLCYPARAGICLYRSHVADWGDEMTVELHLGDCAEVMKTIPPDSIDLTVTSPPYDNLRTYNGFVFDFETIAQELYRLTKPGGVVVWVVGDATINGSETGTSFKQALYFKEIGFNLHDTMIYRKINYMPLTHKRYEQEFEYMFIFSKETPSIFNPILKINKTAGIEYKTGRPHIYDSHAMRNNRDEKYITGKTSQHGNIFEYIIGTGDDLLNHPAPFPEDLARDHILTWSNPEDIVLDPMMGSGTTGKMAVKYQRNFIGIEISQEYLTIAQKRISYAQQQMRLGI
jgi:DNA modification methylase